jgi:hypothetical protein
MGDKQYIAYMLFKFLSDLDDDSSELSDIKDAVLIYTLKDGSLSFMTAGDLDVRLVGELCSAVHTACIYEAMDEPVH